MEPETKFNNAIGTEKGPMHRRVENYKKNRNIFVILQSMRDRPVGFMELGRHISRLIQFNCLV